ncbi:MAG TPA: DUF1501 domain-containing protein [Planctomycetaceae bacterium]|nr:DUF1501 domain-containing protein [Planctomycetaceae bacterium]
MLSLVTPNARYGRREFLRIGSLGLGGLSLPGLMAAQAAAGAGQLVTGKSVIFLFLHGGPSQIETFDPKMTAPEGIRSSTGEIDTRIPGVTFGGTFTKLAALADRLTVVRSFTTGDANHDIKPVVGRDTGGANLGTLYSRIVGTNHATTGMPTNAALFPQAVDPAREPAQKTFGNFESSGGLGTAFAPFVPGAGGDLQRDMQLSLSVDRLDDRRSLLSGLDRVKFALDAAGRLDGLDRLREQAFGTIVGGVAGAFDLSKEDPRIVARYDTSTLMTADDIDKKWNNHKYYVDNVKTLGKLLLLARRLCERGCGFVTVTTNFVWDNHADINNAGVAEGMRYCGAPLDHAVSAFIEDVAERGLSDKILLVCCGEMGRTPRLNQNGGRDHWGGLAPLLVTGGRLKMGQAIGQSTRDAGEPAGDPVRNANLIATIMHTLFDVGELRVTRGVPNEVMRAATAADPIAGLL